MSDTRKIKNALISVFNKDGLENIVNKLHELNIQIYSTGGTQKFIEEKNIPVKKVESLTNYPSILGGRVKTLHPNIFGGILSRRDIEEDSKELEKYNIPEFDLVIVDLYPFEETIKNTTNEREIIEKIDIGGISLIRAAAKNYKDVIVISHMKQYEELLNILSKECGSTSISERKHFAIQAFNVSSHYDSAIYKHFDESETSFKSSITKSKKLRYGENPHQNGIFYGDLDDIFKKICGKDLSYNNLLDIDAAVNLIAEYNETTFAILKHNNACGVASRENISTAWKDALAGDPVSAFGGILITNKEINFKTAQEIDKLFYEVLIAPSFSSSSIDFLSKRKNRVLLDKKNTILPKKQFRTALNGVLFQDKDLKTDSYMEMNNVTKLKPTDSEVSDLIFASKICKHTKSNTIVFAKNKQLIASGVGQTSRVDALKQAVKKAKHYGFDLNGAVMASDAFFPFPDCVSLAYKEGIKSVIQPGGSIKDHLSIKFCDENNMSMVLTGTRHFKH